MFVGRGLFTTGCSALRDQRGHQLLPEGALQVVVICHMDSGNSTLVFCKNTVCS